jgi:hypothetical protein
MFAAALTSACGGESNEGAADSEAAASESTESASAGTGVVQACDLTTPEIVAEIFGGTVGEEKAGPARNCNYEIHRGAAGGVSVYYYGTASEWDGIREGYAENRGPLTDVSDVGDEAFNPDVGDAELVVRSGNVVFAVTIGGAVSDYTPEAPAKLKELAQRIAADVS